ncbi:sirohydrochlorin chelatase [Paenibacillus aceris]|uniref:Sirohydrochlorin cobaltochelatase n=1 Tax=Paenibacillus aceris TaxID=869555 RepID=A0ABS4HTX8_9BACL|nr:sirohydrochlorin chelatase [Paenibacillus aceris]MBP1962073.1 sirohydrochlorin cobaltochelatase [Paenibacillus aceris]NHW34078.1 sirohydrochlorin chelatase [Paenibacillus aceris]
MNAVLFVGHGSREEGGNEEVRQFVSEMAGKLKEHIVETCFLEFVQPTIIQGIDRCIALGASHVVVVPIILFAAGHAKIHIPSAIDDAKRKYPLVKFTYGRPIGVHEQILEILSSRVEDLGVQVDEDLGETALLIVGRGSSDADANSDLFKISRLFWEKLQVKWVETAFIGVTAPLMDEGVERCLKLGAKKVIILPYFLFTGVLIQRMQQMVQGYQNTYPNQQFELAPYFGFHPLLQDILIGRAQEALQDEVKMNCDMCQYRLEAMKHIDHHHHHDHDHHDHHDHDHDHHHHHHDNDHEHHHEHAHDHHDHDHAHTGGNKR